MTLIMWATYPTEGIEVYMDTLVTISSGGVSGEAEKYLVAPGGVVVAGTGAADCFEAWMDALQHASVSGFDDLNELASDVLAGIHAQTFGSDSILATIFHFGWSDALGSFAATIYSSRNGFTPELRIRNGLTVRPETSLLVAPQSDADYLALARRVAREQQQRPVGDPDRVAIGGRLVMLDITRTGVDGRILGSI